MSHQLLITAEELRASMQRGAALVILDTSFDLADTGAGERSHGQAHLPGARYAHLDRDLSAAKTGRNGRHPLPERSTFAARVGEWGVTPATQVVVYDRQQAMIAARAWWMLRWLGHEAVAVLDGGLAAWQAAGGALEPRAPATPAARAPYPAGESLVTTIDGETLAQRLGMLRIIDARAPERYRGETETLDAQAGHIPGAANRFFKDNLRSDGRFKPRDQLRAEWTPFAAMQVKSEVVHHCGSGVTACHNLLAMELAGWGGGSLYPGSWSEWSSDPSRPIARS